MDGVGVPYAKLNSSSFKRLSNDDIVYLGNTTKRPVDIASQTCKKKKRGRGQS